jgi:hypothetical protein
MTHGRTAVLLVSSFIAGAVSGAAQTPPPTPVASPSTDDPAKPPGRLRLGPVYLTPRLHIGSIGLDTNVFYTATERQTDVAGSGGPAIDLVVPFSSAVRLTSTAGIDYLYFARTESQRRFVGNGRAAFEAKGSRTGISLEAKYAETFSRPSFEIDSRVAVTTRAVSLEVWRRLVGRTRLLLGGAILDDRVFSGASFLGTDLRQTLSRERGLGKVGLAYALTFKTSLRLDGEYEVVRFPFDASRDGTRLLGTIGVEVVSTTRLSGDVRVGARTQRFDARPVSDARTTAYAAVDVLWRLSRRWQWKAGYDRDLLYSALVVAGVPTLERAVWRAALEVELLPRMDLRLGALRTELRSDAPIVFEPRPGVVSEVRRNDLAHQALAEIGYRVFRQLRMGVTAAYSERRSRIADLGVDGLLVGGTVTFTP